MIAIRGCILMIVLAGCSQHHGADEALVEEMLQAARLTITELPAASRPTDRELSERVELIAAHALEPRIRAVRAGTLTQAGLRADLQATLARRAPDDRTEPPLLLTLLERSQATWSAGQALLFDALLRQYQEEAGLTKPQAELDTGTR
jgi:hypothetical protein